MQNLIPSSICVENNILSETSPNISQFKSNDFLDIKNESNIIVDSSIQKQFDRKNQRNRKKSFFFQTISEESLNHHILTDQCQGQVIDNVANIDQDQLKTHSNISKGNSSSQNSDQTRAESSLACCQDDDELVDWDMVMIEKVDSFDDNEQGIFQNQFD